MMKNLIAILKGGQGSGNFGHSGRPGEVGGSGGGGGGTKGPSAKDIADEKGFHYDAKTGKITVRSYIGTDPITFKNKESAIKHANGLVRAAERNHKLNLKEGNYINRSAANGRASSISRAKLALKSSKSPEAVGKWFSHHGAIIGGDLHEDNTQF